MHRKPIVIIAGQAKSVFFEIFFKSLRKKKIISPIILICCFNLFKINAKKNNFQNSFNLIDKNLDNINFTKNSLNIIDIEYKKSSNKKVQLKYDNEYIVNCFKVGFKIIKSKITNKFLNGPINKEKFLNKKYLGITEYISEIFGDKKTCMLIYNKELSVCPVTTHLPIKLISKTINKSLIFEKLKIIDSFYKENFKFKPKIAVTGMNPHCESILKNNEDRKIVMPAIKLAKQNKISVYGPFPADTIFLKQNRKKFDVILGMYHDQVLTPIKTLFEYDAINITMGLPFLRVSPDHGPNEKMINKNLSNPQSLIRALEFLDKS